MFTTCDNCRICNSRNFYTAMKFEKMPLLAEPVEPGSAVPSNPLTVMVCRECSYVFLREVIDCAVYNDYIYTAQTSSGVIDYLREFVKKVQFQCSLKRGMMGLEIGSGDGSLCRECNKAGIQFMGIEPSRVLCEISQTQNGVNTLNSFMSHELAKNYSASSMLWLFGMFWNISTILILSLLV